MSCQCIYLVRWSKDVISRHLRIIGFSVFLEQVVGWPVGKKQVSVIKVGLFVQFCWSQFFLLESLF